MIAPEDAVKAVAREISNSTSSKRRAASRISSVALFGVPARRPPDFRPFAI
jgi:hypothetical protein